MVRNLRWLLIILWMPLALAFTGLGFAQEGGEAEASPDDRASLEISPGGMGEAGEAGDTAAGPAESGEWRADRLAKEAAERELELRTQFSELRAEIGALADRRSLYNKPAFWLFLGFLLVLLLAFFLLGFWLMQRLALQSDELKRQRLRLEGMEESLRELPGNLPRPTFDVARLAAHLRTDLGLAASPVEGGRESPSVDSNLPFYHNASWLPRAVEGTRCYLDHLREVRETIAGVYAELSESEDPGEALALTSWMLSRFYHRRREGSEDRWRHLLVVAEESGYLGDPALSERLEAARSDEEAARTLHRALYREILEHSISDHLILLEEMRNLPSFCGAESSHAACQAIARRIDPMVETFLAETRRLAGYTPNYVPLFSEFTDEAARFLRNNASERLPGVYQHLELPRRQVLCVLAYGLRRERGWENEETQVILS